jgi:hypothetical protein
MAFEIDMDATVPVKLMLKSSLKSPETGLEVPRTVSSVTITLFPEFNSAPVEITLVPPQELHSLGTR